MDISKEAEKISNYVVRLRKYFHKYPELSLQEFETSKVIKEQLSNMEIPYVTEGGTGVIGIIGRGEQVIALRADMDAIKILEKNDIGYKSVNDGVMHACGHDAHMAALLGAADILKRHEHELNCTVKLIFQPSEENCMGAKIICDGGHLDEVEAIFGLHVFGDIPCGKISIEEGPRMAASDIFTINISGRSGHAGKPHQCVDALVASSAMVMNIQSIISREFDPIESAVVTIGHMQAGTQHNIIAGEAFLEGTARVFSAADAKHIEQSIKRIAVNTASTYGAVAHVNYKRSMHPVVMNDGILSSGVAEAAEKVFSKGSLIHIPKMMLGEDFSVYQQRIPGVFAFVGAGNEELGRAYPNHHECFNIDEKAVVNSTKLYLTFVMYMCSRFNE